LIACEPGLAARYRALDVGPLLEEGRVFRHPDSRAKPHTLFILLGWIHFDSNQLKLTFPMVLCRTLQRTMKVDEQGGDFRRRSSALAKRLTS
jgi:hypothetical protein